MRRHHYPYKLKLDTGSLFVNWLTRVLTHLCVILSATLAVLFVCDRFKLGEMSLLSNELTRWLLLALCVAVLAAAPALYKPENKDGSATSFRQELTGNDIK